MEELLKRFKDKAKRTGNPSPDIGFAFPVKDADGKPLLENGRLYVDTTISYITVGFGGDTDETDKTDEIVETDRTLETVSKLKAYDEETYTDVTFEYDPKAPVFIEVPINSVVHKDDQMAPKNIGTPKFEEDQKYFLLANELYETYKGLSTDRERWNYRNKIEAEHPEAYRSLVRRLSHIKGGEIGPLYRDFLNMKPRAGVSYLQTFLESDDDAWVYDELLKRLEKEKDKDKQELYEVYKTYFRNLSKSKYEANQALLMRVDPTITPEPDTDNVSIDELIAQNKSRNIKRLSFYYKRIDTHPTFEVDVEFNSGKKLHLSYRALISTNIELLKMGIKLPSVIKTEGTKTTSRNTPEKPNKPNEPTRAAKDTIEMVKVFYNLESDTVKSMSYKNKNEDGGVFIDVTFVLKDGNTEVFEVLQEDRAIKILNMIISDINSN